MAHTDAHRPWWVQQQDPHDRHLWIRCPGSPPPWQTRPVRNLCGCRMCTGHDYARADRRRDRHQAKQAIRRDYP